MSVRVKAQPTDLQKKNNPVYIHALGYLLTELGVVKTDPGIYVFSWDIKNRFTCLGTTAAGRMAFLRKHGFTADNKKNTDTHTNQKQREHVFFIFISGNIEPISFRVAS